MNEYLLMNKGNKMNRIMARTTNFNEQTVPVAVCYVTLANDTSHLYLIVTIETILFIPTHHITQPHSHRATVNVDAMHSNKTPTTFNFTFNCLTFNIICYVSDFV